MNRAESRFFIMDVEKNFFIYLLKQVKGIGNISILKIITQLEQRNWYWESPSDLVVYGEISARYRQRFIDSFSEIWSQRKKYAEFFQNSSFLSILEDAYPEYLREIYNPPVGLFYSGDIQLLQTRSIAIIGARQFSYYGRQMVERIVPELCQSSTTIVSGLARGIDTYAHQLAIRSHGRTVGVIGCGLDVIYPKENDRLQHYMMQHQLVISEYPAGSQPLPFHFPERNRIIAGLSRGTCVVEAKKKSGTFITAQLALESGRDVYAVPGMATLEQSEGCHELIQQGAKCIWSAQHIIEEFNY